jgi:hypothetical protein
MTITLSITIIIIIITLSITIENSINFMNDFENVVNNGTSIFTNVVGRK